MRSPGLTSLFALLLVAALACDRTAELIPGSPEVTTTPTPSAAPSREPLLAPAMLRVAGTAAAGPSGTPGPSDADLARSVVQIRVVDPAIAPAVVRDGSGVIVDREHALILTSALIVAPPPGGGETDYRILVATNPLPGGEPRLTHEASLVAYDPISELAVLRLEAVLPEGERADAPAGEDGEESDTDRPLLDEPAATPGDPATLQGGDPLRLFGHPGLHPSGAETPQAVMVTLATLLGVRAEPAAGERAWYTTEARLPHGNAGGPVFNSAGELVGITTQLAYSLTAPAAHVRPISLAADLIEQAREAGDEPPVIPLMHPGLAPGTALPGVSRDIAVTEPRFALEALGEGGARALFDYGRVFPPGATDLNYEFVVQGAPNGATVQELWYLDGVFQDDLSASYNWELGQIALVSDRLASPNPSGPPTGVWRLEVWVNGSLRAASQAYLGVDAPSPKVKDFAFGTGLSATFGPDASPRRGADHVLAFFAYEGAGLAARLSWVVYRDGEAYYRSPEVPWRGGDQGLWWVGLLTPDGLTAGRWTFEISLDGEALGRDGFTLR